MKRSKDFNTRAILLASVFSLFEGVCSVAYADDPYPRVELTPDLARTLGIKVSAFKSVGDVISLENIREVDGCSLESGGVSFYDDNGVKIADVYVFFGRPQMFPLLQSFSEKRSIRTLIEIDYGCANASDNRTYIIRSISDFIDEVE